MSKQRTWQSWLLFLTTRAALIYLGVMLLGALLQRRLIYLPSRAKEEALIRQAESEKLYPWRDHGMKLIGWRTSLPDAVSRPRNRLVVFHGNAGYALHRSYYVNGFHALPEGPMTWELYLFEYPGYGARAGSPGEESIMAAARQSVRDLFQNDSRPLFLLGESLGSSFAARLAAENPQSVSGLFLVTPMTSLADVASNHYWFLPVRLMLRERHDVQAHLKTFPGPVAFLVAGRDEIMSGSLGQKLFEEYSGLKRIWIQPEARHNTLDLSPAAQWWREVEDFLKNQ
ncbi:MAG: alpha/beta fold hydrolase [Acidobacteria bacterium]|nr:alpha/beta fold hydrolase [Acidobacteriota bacterium]